MWIGSQEISQRFKGEACTAQYYWYQSILVGWEHHDISSNAQPVNLQRERAVGEQHQKRTDRLPEISSLKCFYDTGSRGMSSTAGFEKPQWHSTAHFPHTEGAGKNPEMPECWEALEKKQIIL